MDWKSYEQIVERVYSVLGKPQGVTVVCSGANCRARGKSGVQHQIDVLTSHKDGVHEYKTAIECKYWNATVTKDTVMKLDQIVQDCGISKGVIVSKMGFTADAVTFAKFRTIVLVELRKPDSRDPEYLLSRTAFKFHVDVLLETLNHLTFKPARDRDDEFTEVLLAKLYDKLFHQPPEVHFQFCKERLNPTIKYTDDTREHVLWAVSYRQLLLQQMSLVMPSGTCNSVANILETYKTSNPKRSEVIEKQVTFSEGTILKCEDPKLEISVVGLRFRTGTQKCTYEATYRGDSYVFMIMKAIFENKRFIITEDGKIIEK